jgi:hypothetical protein
MSELKNRSEISEAQIALRAYERWIGRGCPISDGSDDWFAAREQLEAELAAPVKRAAPRTAAKPRSARRARAN